ncbi:Serine protease inhibitor 77Ba [Eumeta japonica]|uniref:Serine protease inhibitor 77Ba n=1 Tax=Eumeta variegata TaxID=151549 RepID=A0A4C1VS05_EUMVA|nr:Serine protease inhibitor 77Ba [Eumeta japonica]
MRGVDFWEMNLKFLFFYYVINAKLSDQCSPPVYKAQISRAIYSFSVELLRETTKESHNFAISPAALWHDLMFLSRGASGRTRDQVTRLLNPPKRKCPTRALRKLYDGLKYLDYDLESRRCVGVVVVGAERNLTVEYKRLLRVQLGVLLLNIGDERLDDEQGSVNGLVSGVVERTFTEFVDRSFFGAPQGSFGLFDVNIFRASIKIPLRRDRPVARPFYDEAGQTVGRFDMLHKTDLYRIVDVPQVRAKVIEIPLDAMRKFSLMVFLPETGGTVREVLDGLVDFPFELVFQMFSSVRKRRVQLLMPPMDVNTTTDFKSSLQRLGVKKMFEASAEFSEISSGELFVSNFRQFSHVQLYKEDIEADETGSNLDYDSINFEANKPFLFYVMDTFYNMIMYCGIYSVA